MLQISYSVTKVNGDSTSSTEILLHYQKTDEMCSYSYVYVSSYLPNITESCVVLGFSQ